MKISKIFFNLFLAGFLLFGFLYIMKTIRYGKDKAVWEAQVTELQADIRDLEVEAKAQYEGAMEWKGKADDKSIEIAILKNDLEEERASHARALAKIPDLAPDEVVSELHRRLQVAEKEIVLTERGVVLSEAVARLVLSRVQSYDFYLAVETPRKDKLIATQGGEIRDLRKTIKGFENTTALLYEDIEKQKKLYEGEHELRLDAESFSLFSTDNLVVGGIVGAVVVGLALLLK
jgi:hypothetical protein